MITVRSAQEFRNLCDAVDNARCSLQSCRENETAAEARSLARWMRELISATAKRPTLELDRMQVRALQNAAGLMIRRAPFEFYAYEATV